MHLLILLWYDLLDPTRHQNGHSVTHCLCLLHAVGCQNGSLLLALQCTTNHLPENKEEKDTSQEQPNKVSNAFSAQNVNLLILWTISGHFEIMIENPIYGQNPFVDCPELRSAIVLSRWWRPVINTVFWTCFSWDVGLLVSTKTVTAVFWFYFHHSFPRKEL